MRAHPEKLLPAAARPRRGPTWRQGAAVTAAGCTSLAALALLSPAAFARIPVEGLLGAAVLLLLVRRAPRPAAPMQRYRWSSWPWPAPVTKATTAISA